MSASFHNGLSVFFRGWSSVTSWKDSVDDTVHVHLTLSRLALAWRSRDKAEVLNELFYGSEAWRATQLVEKQRTRLGLRHYGRKKRNR